MRKPARHARRRQPPLRFTKMHGLGNDFVVIDLLTQQAQINASLVRRLADRRFGVGCDQVLVVEPPQTPDADFRYRIFNADGGEVEQCGNGARCFARFVRAKKFTSKELIRVETLAGPIDLQCLARGLVRVDMGAPVLAPDQVPFTHTAQTPDSVYTLDVAGTARELGVLSMGNPHAVLLVDDVDLAPVELLGPQIQQHAAFPQQVNVGFKQVLKRDRIRLRVFERGAGETLACGTGACAAVVSGVLRGLLDTSVRVTLPGGDLEISWDGPDAHVMMTGPATFVFEGQIRL